MRKSGPGGCARGILLDAPYFTAAFASLLFAVALMPGPALAGQTPSSPGPVAGLTCTQPVDTGKKGKQDVPKVEAIDGTRATTDIMALRTWLLLLAGQYSYDGYVDLCGKGHAADQRPVTGRADCITSGPIPDVHCKVDAGWPETRAENGAPVLGGVSSLRQAQFVYSLENSNTRGIQVSGWGVLFMQADDKGRAEWASGVLIGDTFTAGELCAGIPGNCQKITRITAKPDSNDISMLIEIQIDLQPVMRQAFLLHREPRLQQRNSAGGSP
jgi:hypothetical protein